VKPQIAQEQKSSSNLPFSFRPLPLHIMVQSLESQRPIMAPSIASTRESKRFSSYSDVPPSVSSVSTNGEPRIQEIKELTKGLERLNSTRLQQQRYQPTAEKRDDLSKLALGAKLERALDRRMTSQDAVLKPKSAVNEKQSSSRR